MYFNSEELTSNSFKYFQLYFLKSIWKMKWLNDWEEGLIQDKWTEKVMELM